MNAAELCDGVVAVFQEHSLVDDLGMLDADVSHASRGGGFGEFIEEEPAQ